MSVVRWSDFQETVGTPYLVSAVDGTESVNQAAWPIAGGQRPLDAFQAKVSNWH
jgi:hypothetical protein